MPHLIIEWSANLREQVDIARFLVVAHDAAMATGAFAPAALRTRAIECTHARVADGHPDNAFIHVVLRMRPGRDPDTKQRIGQQLFEAMRTYLAPAFAVTPLGLTFEMQEIDTANRFLVSSLEQHLDDRSRKQSVADSSTRGESRT
jgi:5-carboxymethyl-2-hydroxymuconate isomerase